MKHLHHIGLVKSPRRSQSRSKSSAKMVKELTDNEKIRLPALEDIFLGNPGGGNMPSSSGSRHIHTPVSSQRRRKSQIVHRRKEVNF